jgi:hypothetical protein
MALLLNLSEHLKVQLECFCLSSATHAHLHSLSNQHEFPGLSVQLLVRQQNTNGVIFRLRWRSDYHRMGADVGRPSPATNLDLTIERRLYSSVEMVADDTCS